jgi:hypothetical protein
MQKHKKTHRHAKNKHPGHDKSKQPRCAKINTLEMLNTTNPRHVEE